MSKKREYLDVEVGKEGRRIQEGGGFNIWPSSCYGHTKMVWGAISLVWEGGKLRISFTPNKKLVMAFVNEITQDMPPEK